MMNRMVRGKTRLWPRCAPCVRRCSRRLAPTFVPSADAFVTSRHARGMSSSRATITPTCLERSLRRRPPGAPANGTACTRRRLTVVAVLSSMFWFPAPATEDPRAAAFLAVERQYVTGPLTLGKLAMTALVPIWFIALA